MRKNPSAQEILEAGLLKLALVKLMQMLFMLLKLEYDKENNLSTVLNIVEDLSKKNMPTEETDMVYRRTLDLKMLVIEKSDNPDDNLEILHQIDGNFESRLLGDYPSNEEIESVYQFVKEKNELIAIDIFSAEGMIDLHQNQEVHDLRRDLKNIKR